MNMPSLRAVLARLPLPMLSLSAAYGVYSFNTLFLPWQWAMVSAVAFELVYIGLAADRIPAQMQRKTTTIAMSAVAVSVVYNVLAALFHIRPDVLLNRSLVFDVTLAVLHGLPLAVLSYAVALVTIHHEPDAATATTAQPSATTAQPSAIATQPSAIATQPSAIAAQSDATAAQPVVRLPAPLFAVVSAVAAQPRAAAEVTRMIEESMQVSANTARKHRAALIEQGVFHEVDGMIMKNGVEVTV